MVNLQQRSTQKELLDAEDIPFADIKKNMQELDIINSLLGGHVITLNGLQAFLKNGTTTLRICEIGCGGGDNLRAIYKYCLKKNIAVQLVGIDIKKECIDFAKERNTDLPAVWLCSDYRLADLSADRPDVIFSSLFCHHFNNHDLILMLQWMQKNSSSGFFINDLHRHFLAFYSIKWITKLFSKSYLVKNDAPVSVARGFKKQEWQFMLERAGIRRYTIQWKWAFRYLIIGKNG